MNCVKVGARNISNLLSIYFEHGFRRSREMLGAKPVHPVVDAGGSLRVGVMGDRVASVGAANGGVGAVIFGAVRDSEGINALEFGVKALGTTARRMFAHSGGLRDMRFGLAFETGNWVYADRDAVLVSQTQLNLASGSANGLEQ